MTLDRRFFNISTFCVSAGVINLRSGHSHMNRYMRRRTVLYVCSTKTLISLRSLAVWSESSFSARRDLLPSLSKMCPVKTLIRLCKCAGWSESPLAHMFSGVLSDVAFRIIQDIIQQTHNVTTTSLQRRCNVVTLHRRCNDVPATLCVCWEVPVLVLLFCLFFFN